MNLLVNIALPLPTKQTFTYSIDNYSSIDELIGKRVLVSLGKRIMTGIVVSESTNNEIKNIKPVIEVLDNKRIFSDNILKWTKWISEYYLCSWGDTLKAALPPGYSPYSVIRVSTNNEIDLNEVETFTKNAPKRAALYNLIKKHKGNLTVDFLEKELKTNTISEQLQALENANLIKCERVVENQITSKKQKYIRLNQDLLDNDYRKQILDKLDKSAPKQSQVLNYLYLNNLKNNKSVLLTELLFNTKTSSVTIKSLLDKKLIIEEYLVISRLQDVKAENKLSNRDESILALTDEQQQTVDTIIEYYEDINNETKSKPFLLHGVTGSGKTLVYIHLLKYILKQGKTAILLVPEISLTPQLIDRFTNVFSNQIAVLHSKMTQGERYDSWQAIYKGEKSIVVGARSAIFAPINNLGLIVVDEEHEPSYKQESPVPRYHARDTAIMRAKYENALILLGSATPSIESIYNTKNSKYNLLEIKNRADGALLPNIKVINTLKTKNKSKHKGSFSDEMIEEIIKRIIKKEGVIIFQNRRGFSPFIECTDCGYVAKCKNCDVSLTYHKSINQLRCHYCGWVTKSTNTCPVCGNTNLSVIGFGTQRIEEELKEIFIERQIKAKIARMDLDTTTKKGAHRKILLDFANANTDVLLGTQMVAKGLDFNRVTLVCVINADLQLFLPDFRSTERTYQLITQVSGRAGRTSQNPGEVIIQSNHSDNFSIIAAIKNSYNIFYDEEINNRKSAMYPPFTRFVYIEFSAKDESLVTKHANYFYDNIILNDALIILGPSTPSIYKLKNEYRKIIIIKDIKEKDVSGKILRNTLNNIIDRYTMNMKSIKVKIKVDIDSYTSF